VTEQPAARSESRFTREQRLQIAELGASLTAHLEEVTRRDLARRGDSMEPEPKVTSPSRNRRTSNPTPDGRDPRALSKSNFGSGGWRRARGLS
jgi:hypothetical protein